MTSRAQDPRRLDIGAFIRNGDSLEGTWPLQSFTRVLDLLAPEHDLSQDEGVRWSIDGEVRAPDAAGPSHWLHLQAGTKVVLQCQRCLEPVETAVDLQRSFRFVKDEAAAEALDAEIEEDVLATPRELDLHELLEDELLLAVPLVPLHEVCPEPLVLPPEDAEPVERDPSLTSDGRPNPFAALAALKRKSDGEGKA